MAYNSTKIMRLKTPSGKLVYKNLSRYKIDWDKDERSQFQTDIKKFLYPYLKNHIVYSECPVPGTRLKIDIYDATIQVVFEISGQQHIEYNKFFHKSRLDFLGQIKRDMLKAKFCEVNNIKMVEIFDADLPLTKEWFLEKYDISL